VDCRCLAGTGRGALTVAFSRIRDVTGLRAGYRAGKAHYLGLPRTESNDLRKPCQAGNNQAQPIRGFLYPASGRVAKPSR
jgi:hypothetical protein